MSLLPEDIDAEPGFIVERVTAVARAAGQIIVNQTPIALHERECDLLGLIGRERLDRWIDIYRLELAEVLHLQRMTDGKIQVGDAIVSLEHRRENFIEIGGPHTVSSVPSAGGSLRNWRNRFLSTDLS